MTPLINAAKKHHTEVRYCVKNGAVTKHEKNIKTPNSWVLFILETKKGMIVEIKYAEKANMDTDLGKSVLY